MTETQNYSKTFDHPNRIKLEAEMNFINNKEQLNI